MEVEKIKRVILDQDAALKEKIIQMESITLPLGITFSHYRSGKSWEISFKVYGFMLNI